MSRENLYGPLGSVPKVNPEAGGLPRLNVQANANEFGANIGEAVAGIGEQATELGSHFAQVADEAKVNSNYANQVVPVLAQRRAQYDMLQGQDKVAGYDSFIKDLQNIRKVAVQQQPGIYGQQLMSSLLDRHVEQETFSAKSELVKSQKLFNTQADFDRLKANNGLAADNYNNPSFVRELQQQNEGLITKQYIDNGHDPNHPDSSDMISSAHMANKGDMAIGMINKAVSTGDVVAAHNIRQQYLSTIPGYQQNAIDNTLHVADMQHTAAATVASLHAGAPIPQSIGAPPYQVQALVANTAKATNIDPNVALTYSRIESSYGQNMGTRGTLGQDKESKGKGLDEQAKVMCANIRSANDRASKVLGRAAENWEGYVVYQQGTGGGPALLQAMQQNPNMKAVDALAPLYDNPKDARSAIVGNGGNADMTVNDFMSFVKQRYDDNERRANCDFGTTNNPGQAIIQPHTTSGAAIQPSTTPSGFYRNYQNRIGDMVNQIQSIPNYETRENMMRALEQDYNKAKFSSEAYTNGIVHQADQISVQPTFTSMTQLPADLYSKLSEDSPTTIPYLQRRAEYNAKQSNGIVDKDSLKYGNGFSDALFKVWNNDITTSKQLHEYVKNGSLNIAGYDRLSKEIGSSTSPDKGGITESKKLFYNYAKSVIVPTTGMTDEDKQAANQRFNDFYQEAESAYNKATSEGKNPSQLFSSTSSDYLGKLIEPYKPTNNQIMASIVSSADQENLRVAKEIQTFNSMEPTEFARYAKEARDQILHSGSNESAKQRARNTLLNLEIIAQKRGLALSRNPKLGEKVPLAE